MPVPTVRAARALLGSALLLALSTTTAFADDAPEHDAPFIMSDWMVLAFLVFFSVALAAFVAAWKLGYFHDMESPKYYLLTIDEPDYYTPEWAQEDTGDAS